MDYKISKSFVIFTNKKNPIAVDHIPHGEFLKYVNLMIYLGVEISSDMKWGKHIQGSVSKAKQKQMPSFGERKGSPISTLYRLLQDLCATPNRIH